MSKEIITLINFAGSDQKKKQNKQKKLCVSFYGNNGRNEEKIATMITRIRGESERELGRVSGPLRFDCFQSFDRNMQHSKYVPSEMDKCSIAVDFVAIQQQLRPPLKANVTSVRYFSAITRRIDQSSTLITDWEIDKHNNWNDYCSRPSTLTQTLPVQQCSLAEQRRPEHVSVLATSPASSSSSLCNIDSSRSMDDVGRKR